MEFISQLRPIDLFVVLCLAGGVFAGFTQGITALLNCVVVLIAFVVASILRNPLFDLLTFWQAFTPAPPRSSTWCCSSACWWAAGSPCARSGSAAGCRSPRPWTRSARILGPVGGPDHHLLMVDGFFFKTLDAATPAPGDRELYNALNVSVLVDFFRPPCCRPSASSSARCCPTTSRTCWSPMIGALAGTARPRGAHHRSLWSTAGPGGRAGPAGDGAHPRHAGRRNRRPAGGGRGLPGTGGPGRSPSRGRTRATR